MRVYVASSWRNAEQPGVVARLRAEGHEVYDFRNPAPGDDGFAWSEIDPAWQSWTAEQYVKALEHPLARAGFLNDILALHRCEACVLVQPCGLSAHLEFGLAVGSGKLGIVLVPGIREPELMLAMADRLCMDLDQVVEALAAWTLRAGDAVLHRPSGETWLVASRDGRRDFYACGWPETRARVLDARVLRRATDEEHEKLLREVADSRDDHGAVSPRSSCARQNLEAFLAAKGAAA